MQTFSVFLICLNLNRQSYAAVTKNSKVSAAYNIKINVLHLSILGQLRTLLHFCVLWDVG